jgi:hypothetical protein
VCVRMERNTPKTVAVYHYSVVTYSYDILATMTMEDVRIQTHFALTTFNVALDILFEDEKKSFLAACLLFRLAVLTWMTTTTTTTPTMPLAKNKAAIRFAMALGHLLSVGYWFQKMPFTWESDVWSWQTDLVVGLWLLFDRSDKPQNVSLLCSTVTGMFCWYYAASGFFKINSHFLDPDASCATVFVVLHTSYYAGPFLSEETLVDLCRVLKPFGPAFTILVELLMGFLLSVGYILDNRWWLTTGVLFIIYFHLGVCATPEPLDISSFAVQCAARLILVHQPATLKDALSRIRPYASLWLTLTVLWVSYGVQTNFTALNWAFAGFVPLLALHQMCVSIESPKFSMQSSVSILPRTWWSTAAVSLAAFYSFGCLCLGLMEEMTPNMVRKICVRRSIDEIVFRVHSKQLAGY